jgi:hypothetical protein
MMGERRAILLKSKITMNLRWVSWLVCGLGALWRGAGTAACLVLWAVGFPPLLFLGVFGGSGLITGAAGIALWARIAGRERLKQKLFQDGACVWADIVDISRQGNVEIGGRSPLVLRCKYRHSDGETYLFKSPYLRYNPQSLLPGGRVRVWFDRDNIRKYYVDVDGSIEGGFIEL